MERLSLGHRQAWGFTRAEAEQRIANNDILNAEIVLKTRVRADWRIV